MATIKYKNYEAILIHKAGNRTSAGFSFAAEAKRFFEKHNTAVKMVLFQSTHNNTRLKKYATYEK